MENNYNNMEPELGQEESANVQNEKTSGQELPSGSDREPGATTSNRVSGDRVTENNEAKRFTQQEVDEIVRKRLARVKTLSGDIEERITLLDGREKSLKEMEQTIAARERVADCRDFLAANGYPGDLLEIIDTSDVEAFKAKVETLSGLERYSKAVAPLNNPEAKEDPATSGIASAFSPRYRHTPKDIE